MKPHRVRMTHNLVVNYGLYRQMEVFVSFPVLRISARLVLTLLAATETEANIAGGNDALSF
jgi:hypothetical protein